MVTEAATGCVGGLGSIASDALTVVGGGGGGGATVLCDTSRLLLK